MKINLLMIALLLISSGMMAQNHIWEPGGDLNGTGVWEDASNWRNGLPGTAPLGRAIFRGGTISVNSDVSGDFRVELGDNKNDLRAVLTIETGGIVGANRIASGHSEVGIWAPATLIVEEGASMSTGTHFWIGSTKSYDAGADANMGSEVHINGGTINVGEMFGIDFYNDKEFSGGTLFMNGGLLDLAQWNPGNPDDNTAPASLGKNGKIEYTAGLIQIKGNHKASLEYFRDNGQITGEFAIWVEETITETDTTYVTKLSNINVTEITVAGEDGETTITTGGGTLQMLATVLPENATDPSITWSVSDEGIATIDTDGLLTAVANGAVTVTATANDGSGITGELVVSVALPETTVWNPAAYAESNGLWTETENWTQGLPHPDSKVVLNVAGAADCVLDADATIKQLVVGDNGAGDDVLRIADGGTLTTGSSWSSVAWSTDATLIVETGGTLNFGSHFWAAANGHAIVEIQGTVNVIGMFGIAYEAAWNGSCHLNVNDNGVLNLTNIHPDNSIPEGSYLDINNNGVINIKGDHLSKVENYITLGRITSNNGTGIPNAELVGEGENLKTVISIKLIEVTEITVSGTDDATTITTDGGTLQMIATVLPDNATDATVAWSVNDEAVATINTDGLLTAKADGVVSVTATANDGSGITGSLEITISGQSIPVIEVTGITVAGEDGVTTITTVGGTLQMLATVLPENATDPSVTWSVNNEAVATIDTNGLLTAVSNGDVTVTATANDGSDVTGELVVTVTLPGTTVWNPAANDPGDGLWTTGANWTQGLPHNDSKVVFNVPDAIDCIVNADVSGSLHLVQGDGGPGGVLHIMDGGVVTTRTTGWSSIGWNNPAKLIVDEGGEITFGQHMWIAHNAGADNTEIHLNGGIINIASQFGMDWNGSGNVSTLHLNSGLLNLANIHPTQSMGANSKIIIDGGLMQIQNDHASVMQNYIDAGKIVGKDGGEIDVLVEVIDEVTFTKLSRVIKVTEITIAGDAGATTITTEGGTLQMIATVLPDDATDATVSWSVSDDSIATIDTEGLLTAVANGNVTVIATANDGSEVTGSLTITISGQPVDDILVTTITVTATNDSTAISTFGGTLQMIATVLPTDATDATVVWSVNDDAIATIDTDGLLTAVANGIVTVTATANDGSDVTGSMDITISGQSVDISTYESDRYISIYPNPANTNIIYIQNATKVDVEIYNVTGQIIISSLNTSQVNIDELNPGIYFVRIKADGVIQTSKLIRK